MLRPSLRKHLPRAVAALAATLAAAVGALAVLAQLTAWFPPPTEPLVPCSGTARQTVPGPSRIRLVTWNIGYAGLDKDTDFVMDGGTRSHPRSRQAVEDNLAAAIATLQRLDPDVAFLQEVDHDSARTWRIDERGAISVAFPSHQLWYAANFKSPFVPFPVFSPLGQVDSGIVTLTRLASHGAVRYQLPGTLPWPERLFQLKRCGLLIRFPSPTAGRDWCLLNVHLSAFDDGTQRAQELSFLRDLAVSLFAQGHFVILGGDWNSVFPGVALDQFKPWTTSEKDLFWIRRVPDDWTPPHWTWVFDPRVPTVRTNEKPYRANENYRTIIDGFLLSPNLRASDVQTLDLGFEHADHQPVMATVTTAP